MLEPLEARVPERALRLERLDPVSPQPVSPASIRPAARFASFAALLSGPMFSRLGDIMAANMGTMLDRAEDPARMIRMIVLEMEESLVELRASAAKTVADVREFAAASDRFARAAGDWQAKADLALGKGREDLARLALAQKVQAEASRILMEREGEGLGSALDAQRADIARLEAKLREARTRQQAITYRVDRAVSSGRVAEILNGSRTAGALAGFARLEADADFAEARADALLFGHDDCGARAAADAQIDAQLAVMKTAHKSRLN